MNDLTETLKDIARTPSTFPHALTDAIDECFDFTQYLDERPTYDSLGWDNQVKLMTAYVKDMDEHDVNDIVHIMLDLSFITKADMINFIRSRSGDEATVNVIFDPPWDRFVAGSRAVVEREHKDSIDGTISDCYRDFCGSNGIFSRDTEDEPGELIGFNTGEDA